MLIIESVEEMQKWSKNYKAKSKNSDKKIGFVPTMGSLHEGHLCLIKKSQEQCSKTVVSIFVNPTQFAPDEDYEKYPRDIHRDSKLLEKNEVDVLFLPQKNSIYQTDSKSWVKIDDLMLKYEGVTRPHFFQGVLTVVLKLLHIVAPNQAFFGKKDYQQYFLIQKMCRDFFLPIDIVGCPLIRSKNGLALSSRNKYLNKKQLEQASAIHKNLIEARNKIINENMLECHEIIAHFKNNLNRECFNLDYFAIVDKYSMVEQKMANQKSILLVAACLRNVRLIDNLEIEE